MTITRRLIAYSAAPRCGDLIVPAVAAERIMARLATGRGPQVTGRCAIAPGGWLVDGVAVVDDGANLPRTDVEILAAPEHAYPGHAPEDRPDVKRGVPLFTEEGVVAHETGYDSQSIRWRSSGGSSRRWLLVSGPYWGLPSVGGAVEHTQVRRLEWGSPLPSRFVGALLASEGIVIG